MLAVNEQGLLVVYQLPKLLTGQAYCFCHRRKGRIIGKLVDQDKLYFYVMLLVKTTVCRARSNYPGEGLILLKSMVYAIHHE